MGNFLEVIEKQPARRMVVLCLLTTFLIGCLDYLTGDVSLIILYIVPIYLTVWTAGRNTGLLVALLCGVEIFIVNALTAAGEQSFLGLRIWNSVMDSAMLVLCGCFIALQKNEWLQKEKRSEELASANTALDAFNRTISHDLRQPLNIIGTSCQAIKMLCGDKLDDDCRNYVQIAHNNVLIMNNLIETLLGFSRASQADLKRETTDLSQIARTVAESLRLTEPNRSVTFKIAESVIANGDPNLLRPVLENLLGNAFKYTGAGEEAVIEFGATEIEGERAFYVRDNGKGFDMADADKLFTPFTRLPGAEEFKGFGIGLSTVDRIIRRHGGRVWAEGEPDKGATFYFTLPTP